MKVANAPRPLPRHPAAKSAPKKNTPRKPVDTFDAATNTQKQINIQKQINAMTNSATTPQPSRGASAAPAQG